MSIVHGTGIIVFDPSNITKKHDKHASWKRVAMLMFDCDMTDYYAWFIKRRYNLLLQPPMRGPHVTFINDRAMDMNDQWENVRKKWNGRSVDVEINTDVRTDAEFWWMNLLPNETLTAIRKELGLGHPYFRLHVTIGSAVNFRSSSPNENGSIRALEMHEEQSKYIHKLIGLGLVD